LTRPALHGILNAMRSVRLRGFTLVELMIVVTIVGVLSTLAVIAFGKYRIAGRRAEVYSLFGEIRTKEEAYRSEFSSYLGTDVAETNFYPVPNNTPQTWSPPAGGPWTQLGVNPGRSQVYCGYVVIAGTPGVTGNAGARGLAWFNNGGNAPSTQWWYANASCDNDGKPATTNAEWTTSMDNTSVLETNPQQ
jgi:type IV pilus assembly protein PilE